MEPVDPSLTGRLDEGPHGAVRQASRPHDIVVTRAAEMAKDAR